MTPILSSLPADGEFSQLLIPSCSDSNSLQVLSHSCDRSSTARSCEKKQKVLYHLWPIFAPTTYLLNIHRAENKPF
jgi:hypothetical protein